MAEQEKFSEKTPLPVNEISLSEIFAFIKRYALWVALAGLIFGILGYAASFLLPVKFKASTMLLPESGSSSGGMGSLSSLARLGGLTKNDGAGAIQPDLYPTILTTIPFAVHLLKQPVVDENNHQYKSIEEFLHSNDENKKEESPAPAKTAPKIDKDIVALSKAANANANRALALVSSTYEMKTGIITISSETPDPFVAAQVVKLSSDYLIEYVSNYRTQKTVREVQFLGERVAEAKKREQSAEFALQSYRDRNRNAFLNVARIEEQRLQADYLLAQTLYSEIVRRWEEAKIKVKEEQPVIKVLEPVQVPLVKSKPKRLILTLFAIGIGSFATIFYLIFFKKNIKRG